MRAARQRILLIDGAMGTQIQCLNLDETHFRGDRFHACERHLQGNNDLLTLTQPQAIEDIHLAYALAGAPTFSRPTPSPRPRSRRPTTECRIWSTNSIATGRDWRAGRRSRRRRRTASAASSPALSGRPTAPRRCRPTSTIRASARLAFDELRIAYGEQIRGLIDGGAEILLIETIFDTLNAKAAIFACFEAFAERGFRMPLMISGTITDRSGRTLSGQTPTAFWHSVRHARPFSIGLNCALGASAMREHLTEIAEAADTLVCAYPNAGLPNAFGQYDESPEAMAAQIGGLRRRRNCQHCGGMLRLDAGPHPRHRRGGPQA